MELAITTLMTRTAKPFGNMFSINSAAIDTSVILKGPSPFESRNMMIQMFDRIHQNQIFWAIIQRIVIQMMDMFIAFERATDLLDHYNSMFVFPFAWTSDFNSPVKQMTSGVMQLPTSNRNGRRMSDTLKSLLQLSFPCFRISSFMAAVIALKRIVISFSIMPFARNDWTVTNPAYLFQSWRHT